MGSPVPENSAGASSEPKAGEAVGADDQVIWLAAEGSEAVRGGCPGARFGGNPRFGCGDGMPVRGNSPSMEDCCGAGGQAGGAAGA